MSKIFISYRRQETAFICTFIYEYLAARYGSGAIFLDVDTVLPGIDFVQLFDAQIQQCPVVLVVMGPQWVSLRGPDGRRRLDDPNDFVRTEVRLAIQRAQPNVRGVIPLLIDHAIVPSAAQLPPDIQRLPNYSGLEIRPGRDFNVDMQRLYSAIEAYGIAPLPVPAAMPTAVPDATGVAVRATVGPQIARWGAMTAIPAVLLALIFVVWNALTVSSASSVAYTPLGLSFIAGAVAPFVAGLIVARRSGSIFSGTVTGVTSNAIASVVILVGTLLALAMNSQAQVMVEAFFFGGLVVALVSLGVGLFMGWLGALIGAGSRRQ